ncbi:class I SAM-dependent methyltransferase [Chloroflexi bacterium TSY]|nr:class I SAM-dependent methyltransferase [Chloroflexi bacterium TSY]
MSTAPYDPFLNAQRPGYTHPGFADRYDAYRPRPPAALIDLLLQLANTVQPDLVVDLGSGTGISTFIWTRRARQVLGIEPLDAMRLIAEAANTASHVNFQAGIAQHTSLPDGAADIVTCGQALHWMEPVSTLAEAARILRSGGVFAAYDYDWPPTVQWEAERAFEHCMARLREWWQTNGSTGWQQWAKSEHLARMQQSGHFRYVKEVAIHHIERCTAERWVGYVLSRMPGVLDQGVSATELGLDELRQVAQRILGERGLPGYISYRVRVGVK